MSATWLQSHVEEFIKPRLKGQVPKFQYVQASPKHKVVGQFFTPQIVQWMKLYWDRAKEMANGKPILLPGRDVYLFEVLARVDDYPTTFKPEYSSSVVNPAGYISGTTKRGWEIPDYNDHFLVDTGYAGSIPKALKQKDWALMWYTPSRPIGSPVLKGKEITEWQRAERLAHQLFHKMTYSQDISYQPNWKPRFSHVSAYFEGCAKYWQRAMPVMDAKNVAQIKQEFMAGDHFNQACQITMFVAQEYMKLKGMISEDIYS